MAHPGVHHTGTARAFFLFASREIKTDRVVVVDRLSDYLVKCTLLLLPPRGYMVKGGYRGYTLPLPAGGGVQLYRERGGTCSCSPEIYLKFYLHYHFVLPSLAADCICGRFLHTAPTANATAQAMQALGSCAPL